MTKSVQSKLILLLVLLLSVLCYVRCNYANNSGLVPFEPIATAYDGSQYAGSETCMRCHEDIYKLHLQTPHYSTSQNIDKDKVIGDFFENNNTLEISNGIVYKMTDEGKLYQTAYQDGKHVRKEAFDITVGSGTKGQTYLYWDDTKLYQLPVSSLKNGNKWILSPGYSDENVRFDRAVIPNCLQCHATFAKNRLPSDFKSNSYVKKEVIFGVNCESCHGPALTHVNAHVTNPELKEAQHILDITTLNRQQQLDACAKCHSGLKKPLKKPFTFKTGDNLNSYKIPNYRPIDTSTVDVHGNQYGLLTASKCFKKSAFLNCTTCHNPHDNERDRIVQFSQKCISCHQDFGNHKIALNTTMQENCIDCHMPLITSSAITFSGLNTENDSIKVRTHKIGIYQDISEVLYKNLK